MSHSRKEAQAARRFVREYQKTNQPLRIVPSKRGLTAMFSITAILGFACGLAGWTLTHWIRNHG
jgi:hypothetical protein